MRWISSAGGPLIILEERLLQEWNGIETPFGFEADAEVSDTDYGRACQCTGYLDLLIVGRGQAVVVGDVPTETSWVTPIDSKSRSGGMLVCWGYAEGELEIEKQLATVSARMFPAPELRWSVESSQLLLFDSALSGLPVAQKPDEYIRIDLSPGIYDIATLHYRPDPATSLILHQFMKI
jgi:hypothetical protein